ncbi:hypothetical protein TNCV_4343001 [Trichonephila clavipes]|nr:hypothetical protein TNCV_4343001 [Trichonephila clavipes]
MHNATVQQPITTVSPNSNLNIVILQAEAVFVSKHNAVPFCCPCPPLIASLVAQMPAVSSQGIIRNPYRLLFFLCRIQKLSQKPLDVFHESQGCGSPVVKVSDNGRHVMSSSPVPLRPAI